MNDGLLSDMGVREPEGRRIGGASIASGNIDIPFGGSLILRHQNPSSGVPSVNGGGIIFKYATSGYAESPFTAVQTSWMSFYNNGLYIYEQGNISYLLRPDKFAMSSGIAFGWAAGASADGTYDTILLRDAAQTVAQRNATTAQLFKIYNTWTSTTNFERLDLQWVSNVCQLWTEKGSGGGTARPLVLGADATELMRFDLSSKISFFGATTVVKQTSGADLTNNVTSGGTTDTITDWTNLSTYSTDAAAIRNAVYQLSRKVKQLNDGLRAYGLFT